MSIFINIFVFLANLFAKIWERYLQLGQHRAKGENKFPFWAAYVRKIPTKLGFTRHTPFKFDFAMLDKKVPTVIWCLLIIALLFRQTLLTNLRLPFWASWLLTNPCLPFWASKLLTNLCLPYEPAHRAKGENKFPFWECLCQKNSHTTRLLATHPFQIWFCNDQKKIPTVIWCLVMRASRLLTN